LAAPERRIAAVALGLAALLSARQVVAAETRILTLAEAGPEMLGGEYFLVLDPAFVYEADRFAVELAAPLRFRMNATGVREHGLLRREDWDERADAGRALRRVELTLGERVFTLRLGALSHRTVGHGTLVNGYGSSLDPDRLPLGGVVRLVLGGLAVETLVSNLLGPGLFGVSVSLEPLSLGSDVNDRVHLGAAFFWDPPAPRGPDAPSAAFFASSFDVAVVRTKSLKLAPYADLNGRRGGIGIHAGVLADVLLDPVEVSLKAEWRRTDGSYQPEYFDLAYSLEREVGRVGEPEGKADDAFSPSHGWRAEMRAAFPGLAATASVSRRASGMHDASCVMNLDVAGVELAALAAARDFSFHADPRLVLTLVEARWRVHPYIYVWGLAGRLYRVQPAEEGRALVGINQLGAGVGVALAP